MLIIYKKGILGYIKNIYILVVLVLAVTILCGCGSDKGISEGIIPENELANGWNEYAKGNYRLAILSFEKVINYDSVPLDIIGDAYNGLGWSYTSVSDGLEINRQNLNIAIGKFAKAIEYNNGNSDAWIGYASALFARRESKDDINKAISSIDNAIEINKVHQYRHGNYSESDIYALKAQCLYYLGKYNESKKEIEKSLIIDNENLTALTLKDLLNEE